MTSSMKILAVSVFVCILMVLAFASFCPSNGYNICPCNWREFGGRCFHYVKERKTWAEAEQNCHSMNANLVSIHNEEEELSLKNFIIEETQFNLKIWIGASDCWKGGSWYWSDGTQFSFTDWCRGQPNNLYTGQDCATIKLRGRCWDDRSCTDKFSSICAKRIQKSHATCHHRT
ncbi:galactose-specific lectin nattectin-like [Synchiropus picturatus]